MTRHILAPAILAGLIAGAFIGFHLGLSMAQPADDPGMEDRAHLEAECTYVAGAGARAFDAATAALWSQHGPTGLPLEYVDTEALTARRN